MACCGQQRAAFTQQYKEGGPFKPSVGFNGEVQLRFMQKAAVSIRGPVTGRHYQFHEADTTQQVDPRDAAIFIRSGYFLPA